MRQQCALYSLIETVKQYWKLVLFNGTQLKIRWEANRNNIQDVNAMFSVSC
jgi:hypothetical protein